MQSRQSATLGVSVAVFVIASVFVVLRFISRVFVVRRVGLHDYLMLLAWVCTNPRVAAASPGACSATGLGLEACAIT